MMWRPIIGRVGHHRKPRVGHRRHEPSEQQARVSAVVRREPCHLLAQDQPRSHAPDATDERDSRPMHHLLRRPTPLPGSLPPAIAGARGEHRRLREALARRRPVQDVHGRLPRPRRGRVRVEDVVRSQPAQARPPPSVALRREHPMNPSVDASIAGVHLDRLRDRRECTSVERSRAHRADQSAVQQPRRPSD